MKTIDIKEIQNGNFTELKPSMGGTQARLYTDLKKVYKIYRDELLKDVPYMRELQSKIKMLSTLYGLDDAVLPIEMIVDKSFFGDVFMGYSMKYLDGVTLHDLYENDKDFELFHGLINTSKATKRIHERRENIVLGDANLSNVMLISDDKGKHVIPKIVDFDGVQIGGIYNEFIPFSKTLIKFFIDRRESTYTLDITSNIDRLSYLLEFIYILFGANVYELSLQEYDNLSCEIKGLKDIKKIILELRDLDSDIPYIPYLHEVMNEKDEEAFVKRYEIMC